MILAVTMASVTQIRVLGGTIGLAVCSALLNNYLAEQTSKFLTPEQIAEIILAPRNIASLPTEVQSRTRSTFAEGYSQQMRVMLYFSIASVVSLILLTERHPRRVLDAATAKVSKPRQ